jgi:glycosyltransferase involved in cell wall biosynthesis
MPKYKLLVVMQKDPLGEGIGGMHTYIRGLVKYRPDDFEVELVGITTDNIRRPAGKWKTIRFAGKNISFLPVLFTKDQNKSGRVPLSLRFVISLMRYRSRIPLEGKILEFHRVEPAFLFNRSKNKSIIFIHGNVEELYNPHSEIKWTRMPWLYFQLEKRVMPNTDRVLVVSKKGLDFYSRKYKQIRSRFSFIPTWVDGDVFYPADPGINREKQLRKLTGKFNISASDKILLFAGRLVGSKNPILLIDSFHRLYIRDKKFKLLIVGSGSLKGKVIKRIGELGLKDNIRLLGILPQEKLACLCRLCDLFLLTSACEGMPRAVIEALASGVPVVSTNVGEIWRVVKDNYSGMLVSKNESSEIAQAVIKVLENKNRYSISNCLDAVKDYRIGNVVGDIYQVLRDTASGKHKS